MIDLDQGVSVVKISGCKVQKTGFSSDRKSYHGNNWLKQSLEQNSKSDRVQTSDAFWRSGRVLVIESFFYCHSFMFQMLLCSNSDGECRFSEIPPMCDGRTDGRTDRPKLWRYEIAFKNISKKKIRMPQFDLNSEYCPISGK